jgi:hypothetical protein
MMTNYVAEHGLRIRLVDILNACHKQITDLPTLPDYIDNGCPYVCWAHILGRCTFNDCQFKRGHIPRRAITNGFAEQCSHRASKPALRAEGEKGPKESARGSKATKPDTGYAAHNRGAKENGAQRGRTIRKLN